MNKIIGILQLIFVVLFIAGALFVSGLLKSEETNNRGGSDQERILFAESKIISPSTYQTSLKTTGIVEARSNVTITPQVSGRVVRVNPNFAEGGIFKKGEVLFQIESEDFVLNVDQLRSNVASAQTALELEQAESAAALAEWQQVHGSLPIPDLVARKPQLEQAKANLKAAQAQLRNANLDLNRSRFTMPFDGRVISANIEKGQFVTAGQNYGSVYDLTGLEISASLNPKKISWLFETDNPDIQITIDHKGEKKSYEGIINRNVAAIDSTTRFADVNFGFKEQPSDILLGSFATIKAQGPNFTDVLVIPSSALQKTGEIWTISEEKTLAPLEAQVVFSNEDVILAKNNQDSVRIVTSKVGGATAGIKVNTNDDMGDDMGNNMEEAQ